LALGRSGNPHVTAHETSAHPRWTRESRRGKTSRIPAMSCPSRGTRRCGLGKSGSRFVNESHGARSMSDRGVRGTVCLGAYGRELHARTRATRRSWSSRREAQGHPVSLIRAQASRRGRGASLEKMLETREARVLVVEAVGSKRWSKRIELVLPSTAARQVGRGRASPSQAVLSADAE